ncbi:MAG: hypothetical protein ACKO6N_29010 [Myxococcota bacterium]
MTTFILERPRLSTVTLQRMLLVSDCLTPEQQQLFEQSRELQEEADLLRQLYWDKRRRAEHHRAHHSTEDEDQLVALFCGQLSASESETLWAQIDTCWVCQDLAEQVGVGLQRFECNLTPRATQFMEARLESWQLREDEWWSAYEQETGTTDKDSDESSHITLQTVSHPPLHLQAHTNEVKATSATLSPRHTPSSRGEGILKRWWTQPARMGWSMHGLAAASACALLLLLTLRWPSTSDETHLEPWIALQDRAATGIGNTQPHFQAKGVTQTQEHLKVSLEGELLMEGKPGEWEVVASLHAVSRPRAQAPNTAQLRLSATIEGSGWLTLWHISQKGIVRLYDWPYEPHQQQQTPLTYTSGERLALELPHEQGSHVFLVTLSAEAVPSDAAQSKAWLERLQSGQLQGVALSRIIWDIRT